MKLNEFSKRIGLPLTKLRYYARYGVTEPERNDNNYRDFTKREALDVYNALLLRSYDMSIEDIAGIHKENHGFEINGWINEQIGDLENRIEHLQVHLTRLKELQQAIELFQKMKGKPFFSERFSEYVLWSFDDDFDLNEENVEMLRRITDRCPFSYIALDFKEENRKTECKFSPVLGIGILKKNIDKCALSIPNDAKYTKDIKVIAFYLEKESLFELTKEDLKPMYEFANEMGVEMVGRLTGRFYLSYLKNGKRVYCFAVCREYQQK